MYQKIVSTYDRFEDIPGYARRVPLEEISSPANDWNLNIRRYVDNSPPPEPHDVRAHLLGGVPVAEVEAQRPLFEALGFDPTHAFAARANDTLYFDFAPSLTDRSAIRPLVENDHGVQARVQSLREALTAWWVAHSAPLAELPRHGELNRVRSEILEQICQRARAAQNHTLLFLRLIPLFIYSDLGLISASPDQIEAEEEVAALGPEQSERSGIPLSFRKPEQQPAGIRGTDVNLRSQQILVAGMLRPAHLLDLMRNFTVFQQLDGKTRKVVARYQPFRAIHRAVSRLQEGRTRNQGAPRDERGGMIWHAQGSGKSFSMVFLVRKMRMTPLSQSVQGGRRYRSHRFRSSSTRRRSVWRGGAPDGLRHHAARVTDRSHCAYLEK